MKIFVVSPGIFPVPPVKGGAVETCIYESGKYLGKGKIEVYCLGIGCSSLPSRERMENVEYLRFTPGIIAKILMHTYKLPFKRSNSFWYNLPYSLWCALRAKLMNVDIIHIHSQAQFVPIIKYFNPKAKILLHIHQLSSLENYNIWNEYLFKRVDLVIGVSRFVTDVIKKRFSGLKNKTIFVHNGVDINKFRPIWEATCKRKEMLQRFGIGDAKVVLYVGRLVKNKGLYSLVEAFRKVLNSGIKDVKLVICGGKTYCDDSETEYIKMLRSSISDFKEKVIFTGYISYVGMPEIFLLGDLLIVPSLVEEGFSLVTTEGLASGLAVIANARGGIPEIINDGENGILIFDDNIDKLKSAIIYLLKNDNKRLDYGRKGREKIEKEFSWSRVGYKLTKVYEGFTR